MRFFSFRRIGPAKGSIALTFTLTVTDQVDLTVTDKNGLSASDTCTVRVENKDGDPSPEDDNPAGENGSGSDGCFVQGLMRR